jgi:CRP-like cAMP-binding protein
MAMRRARNALALPRNCADCPVNRAAVCRAFLPDALHIPASLKRGDRVVRAGGFLLEQGQPYDALYHLLDGWAAVSEYTNAGKRCILDILLPGSFIGYQSLVGEPAAYTVEALTPCSFCVYPRQGFANAIQRYSQLGTALIETTTAQRDRGQLRLAELGRHGGRGRLALLLLDLYERTKRFAPTYVSGIRCTIPLTHDQLADAAFMSRIHLHRHLRGLREAGVLAYSGWVFDFIDLSSLRAIAEGADPAALRTGEGRRQVGR